MADSVKSSGISRRRMLLEEVLAERSKAVATLPLLEDEPAAASPLWRAGIARLAAARLGGPLPRRRVVARNIAVVALAWLEAIDAELDLEVDRG